MGAATRPALVGRGEELAFCEGVLLRRDGTGLVITGAAGVGKTRLASEALIAAESLDFATLRVTATEAGRAVPLGPFAGALPLDAGEASAHLIALARHAIGNRGDGRRVVLLVDDAHLLDPASAMLVQQLTAAREVTVIATVRSGEPVPDAVVALWKDHGCEYLDLQPLSLEETGELVESLVGGDVDGQTKQRLWEASRGVPLLVRELVLGALDRQAFILRQGLWRWRGEVHAGHRLLELVGTRIGDLEEAERALLELVAIGEPVAWSFLEDDEPTAAETLMRRELVIAERAERRLELRLAHPLFGEVVRARLPPTRAAALQARLADALEASGLKRSGDLIRFAVWRLESGGTATPAVLLRSVKVAFNSFDFPLAERLARAASAGGGGFEAERALAVSFNAQGRFDEGDAILRRLATSARTDGERVDVARGRATSLGGAGRLADAEAMLAELRLDISEEAPRRELDFVLSIVAAQSGRFSEAVAGVLPLVADEHFGLTRRVEAASVLAGLLVMTGRSEESLDLIGEWEAHEGDADPMPRTLLPSAMVKHNFHEARILALLYSGRVAEAAQAVENAVAVLTSIVSGEFAAMLAVEKGLLELFRGRVTEAERSFREAAGMVFDDVYVSPHRLALGARALAHAGDSAVARDIVDRLEYPTGTWHFDPDVLLARAWVAAAEGALSEAQRLAGEAADLAEERGALAPAFLAAHDVVRLGDPGGGASRLARLAERVQGSLVRVCAEHADAVASADAQRVEDAAARFAELGVLLWAAEAESEAAAAHRQAGREQSARAAAARAALLLERCSGARTPALALAGPVEELTPREREIVGLAAGGLSNRAIAERLVVSVRTVENNLQRAYGKLGVRNRRELADLLRASELE
jgi:DNA-binding NarL/FixJ family response regulator